MGCTKGNAVSSLERGRRVPYRAAGKETQSRGAGAHPTPTPRGDLGGDRTCERWTDEMAEEEVGPQARETIAF